MSVSKVTELPEALQPYEFHKVVMTSRSGSKEFTADCPFCGRSQKLSINSTNGMWRCLVCNEGEEKGKSVKGGNSMSFLRTLFRLGREAVETPTPAIQERYKALAAERGFLQTGTLHRWELAPSLLTNEWTIPSYNPEGKLCQLSRYARIKVSEGVYKNRWLNTKGLSPQIFGMHLWNTTKPFVYVCEGPWDAMILYEMLTSVKRTENGLAPTGSIRSSLYNDANIIALPGCNQFNERWRSLFEGKHVILMFDNDHPKKHPRTGQLLPPAALAGAQRVTEILTAHHKPPESINYLRWGTEGFDPSLPSGTDLRDVFKDAGNVLGPRIKALDKLLSKVTYVPDEWVKTPARASGNAKTKSRSDELECTSYKDLVNSWRKALKWTEGLDHALACMLATVSSTMRVGDQLWMKIIGPASCLDGDTKIYDPVDKSNLTVRERAKLKKKFFVYSRTQDGGLKIGQALPPEEYQPAQMFEVTFKSGKQLRVTFGHEFWDGKDYVSLKQIYALLQKQESFAYPLQTISGSALLAQTLDAQRLLQTTEGSLENYSVDSYPYGEPLQNLSKDAQYVAPLHDGVPELTQCDCYDKSEYERNHRCQHICHSSNIRELSRVSSSQYEDATQLHATSGSDEHFDRWSSLNDNTLPETTLEHKGQPTLESAAQSNAFQTLHYSQQESYKREPDLPEAYVQFDLESNPVCTYVNNHQSSSDSNLAFSPVLGQPHSTLSNVSELLSRTENAYSIERNSSLQDITLQVRPDEPETNLLEQPQHVSIDKGIELGQLPLPEFDEIVKVRYIGERNYYDFHVPLTNNYWAEGFFHHNCGKTTLGQALASNDEHVVVRDVIRGFTSGWRQEDGSTYDLASEVNGKTMLTLDGDTLIQSPGLTSILSEGRRLYDGSLTSHFKNGAGKDIADHRFTWLLFGTSSLRSIDSSELGERFLDCVVMEGIDDELEDEILMRVANRVVRNMSIDIHQVGAKQDEPDMTVAKAMTAGYVTYLKKNLTQLMSKIQTSDEALFALTRIGKFVAFMRARPSELQDETAEREFAARLVSQHIRLASCLAVVLNKDSLEGEPLKRTRKVALDTARGKTMEICRHLYAAGEDGLEPKTIALYTTQKESEVRKMLRFLRQIQVTEVHMKQSAKGIQPKSTYRLTKQLQRLWAQVHEL